MTPQVDARIDVREVDGEPFGDIVDALDELESDEILELVAPFEPVPLYSVLDNRGFDHETSEDGDLFRVYVEHP